MKYRQFGRTGFQVSEIGFGAWGIGGRTEGTTSYGTTDDDVSMRALAAALDCGINFFDTSSVYGYGHSEHLIAEALRGKREQCVIATKAGFTRYGEQSDYSPGHLRRSLEGSLARLRTDYVDLLLLHSAPLEVVRSDGGILAELELMQQEGLIRAYGLSAKSPAEARDAIIEFGVPAVQVNLNMMDIRAVECGLLDAARRHGTAVIARTPLCFGFLSGSIMPDTAFPAGDHRNGWPREQIARWCNGANALQEAVAAPGGGTLIQMALRYCLSFSEIATVIPGMLTSEEVIENAAASDLGPLPEAALTRVAEINRAMRLF